MVYFLFRCSTSSSTIKPRLGVTHRREPSNGQKWGRKLKSWQRAGKDIKQKSLYNDVEGHHRADNNIIVLNTGWHFWILYTCGFLFLFLYLLFIENSEFSNKKNIIFGCNGLSTSCPGPSVTLKRGKSELFAIDKSLKTWKTASYRKVQISPRSQNTMENFISTSVLHNWQ